ncbi:MAG: DinB family protein [Ignavibacteriales bacterium]|nr:DinB family protein [Ignavibacteriales bacterium]
MYRTIQDFLTDWTQENDSTLKVFKNLTDTSLKQKVSSEGRSLGHLAWHIVLTLGEMGDKAGLKVDAPPENSPDPNSASIIIAAYEKAGASLASEIKQKWNDGMLFDEIDMYGQKWTRTATLTSIMKHQIHHRAQMTVLMRQAGLTVPGVYGPSREEWSQFGMPAQE